MELHALAELRKWAGIGNQICPTGASTVPNFNPNRSLDLVCILSLINRKIILPQSPESMLIVGELAQENRGKINI